MIRLLDLVLAVTGLIITFPLLLSLALIGMCDTGSPLFRQIRVGKDKKTFTLVKFRTMRVGTTSVATHLVDNLAITRFGGFLRKSKLDELPQLWNVVKGDMSLVGPRPGLVNQKELTKARDLKGVYLVKPGITGLSQINEIDMSTPELIAETDAQMIRELSVRNYMKIILQTIVGKGSGDRIRS